MIIKNRLFLKIPDRKPPFIGIEFEPHSGIGALTHQDLIRYKNKEVSLLIRRSGLTLEVIVFVKGFYHTYGYSSVYYSPGELQAWLKACQNAKTINFGHVIKHDFGHVLCHTHADNKAFFIPLDKLVVIEEPSPLVIVKQ